MSPSKLPRRVLVHVDFGALYPAVRYQADPAVIVRFVKALKSWNPNYRVFVEPVEFEDDGGPPQLPCWRLFAWHEPDDPHHN